MTERKNPLLSDRDVDFILHDMLDVTSLCRLADFNEHGADTFEPFIQNARRLARDVLFPSYKPIDAEPPRFESGRILTHPRLREVFRRLVKSGMLAAGRPSSVGGEQMPLTILTAASLYLMAGNLSAYAYLGLTTGAAHLIEAFGSDALRRDYMARMYRGEWTGTMALTEPHAGSSLADVTTRARRPPSQSGQSGPSGDDDGHYLVEGSKIFISAGDHDLTENIVHMVLARIEGAPAGIKGVSLFCVPRMRLEGGALADNDVHVAGAIHKVGWRGLPSLALNFGERGDCHGFLVGEPHNGIGYMFQMMNEARIMIGANAVATASVAYHASLAYAESRPQGRPLSNRGASTPQVPIIEHADVRRMLLRQKAIVEGGLALVLQTAFYSDLATHLSDDKVAHDAHGELTRHRARLLLDLLTPVAKTFPAERGFESNTLALQIHGGYGYSSEYLPEAWLRDQKLNTIHEGTTGIQGMDLLGRKVMAEGGAALQALLDETDKTIARAKKAGVDPAFGRALEAAGRLIADLTLHLGMLGAGGDPHAMMLHSADYMELFSIFVIAWQWLLAAAAATETLARQKDAKTADEGIRNHAEGKLLAAQYWFRTELPRVEALVSLCKSGEDSYARMKPAWF